MKTKLFSICASLWLGMASSLCVAGERVERGDVSLPTVSNVISQSSNSYAFNAAAHTQTPQDLGAQDYVEEEYLLSGDGRIFDLPPDGKLQKIGAGPYTTRILVRRPRDPARFSGSVIVEPLNSSMMADLDLMWMLARDQFMRKGSIWVGVTHKPVSGETLKRFDPVRYAGISFANPLPVATRCPDLEIGPQATQTEVGFEFDILSQLGALLRSNAPDNPLRGYGVKRLYMTGFSQTAGIVRAYAVSISPLVTRAGGQRIYDGYMFGGHAPFSNLFNNCDKTYSAGDPRLVVTPVGVPLIDIAVEGDVPVSRYLRREDSDKAPDLYRHYEIAGGTHSGLLFEKWGPNEADLKRLGLKMDGPPGCVPGNQPPSAFPINDVFDAMWQNLDRWVADGIPPPHGEPIRFTKVRRGFDAAGHLVPVRDRNGNAIGGVRTVAVDVPTASWFGARDGNPLCLRSGYGAPYGRKVLRALYPSHEAYVQKVEVAVRRLEASNWLTAEDGQAIVREAKAKAMP